MWKGIEKIVKSFPIQFETELSVATRSRKNQLSTNK